MKLKLTSKLLLPLICLVIIGLGSAVFMAYINARQGLESAIVSQLSQTSSSVESQLSQWLVRNAIDLENWAGMSVMADALDSATLQFSREAASARMQKYIDTHGIFSRMHLTNDKGVVVASSSPKSINKVNVFKRVYFKASMQGKNVISDPLISSATQKPILVMSSPVGRSGKIMGILFAVIDLGGFTDKWLDNIRVGKTGYVYMMDEKGLALAYPPDKKQIMKLDFASFGFGRKILEMKNGSFTYTHDGIKKISVFNQSPVKGWVVVASAPETEVFAEAVKMRNLLLMIGGAVILLLGCGIVMLVRTLVIRPINSVVAGLKVIARGEGDLTQKLPVTTRDELGELCRWFNTFLDNLQRMVRDIGANSRNVGEASDQLLGIANDLATGAEDSSKRANTLTAAQEEARQNMNAISGTMEATMENTAMVAASAEEMSATINEIAKNSEVAREISLKAVAQAGTASEKINELGEAAKSIGMVTETINDISDQTNLLALNATIEAARAGEAGKGFAVVANEIKDLANQTAAATSDIKEKISGVQETTEITTQEIISISGIVNDINDIIDTIAAAIQEQSSATEEISKNVTGTSEKIEQVTGSIAQGVEGIEEVNRIIVTANESATDISRGSQQVAHSAEELQKMAAELNSIVGKFQY